MRLPIRTDELEFIVATAPKPLPALGGEARERVRQGRDDRPIYVFNVLATSGMEADVISVQVEAPIDVAVGEGIRLRTLTAECWQTEGRSCVSFRAEDIERVGERGASEVPPTEDAGSW
ncbi:MAG: hypothetical protein ACRDLN_03305 [Solirubrobacteraceae bacterium]